MESASPFHSTTKNDFCVEVDDDESNLLNVNASKVKDQNSRLLDVYKKTQSNCKRFTFENSELIGRIFSASWR